MIKDKKLKFNDDSKLMVRKVVQRFTNPEGRKVVVSKWFLVEDELNLGSFRDKKNTDILEYKYDVPSGDVHSASDILKGLFKK